MKVTLHLRNWMREQIQSRDLSYTELGKRAAINYQNFQQLVQGSTEELTSKMEDAVCRAFGITHEDLYKIVLGKVTSSSPVYNDECEKATALWRWIAYDVKRIDILKALGYGGELPVPTHGSPRKKND